MDPKTREPARYVASDGWEHVFRHGRDITRWAYDTHAQAIVAAQVRTPRGWRRAAPGEADDLLDSLHQGGNEEALDTPGEGTGTYAADAMPAWATAAA